MGIVALTVALLVSLALNGVVGVRYRHAEERIDALERQVLLQHDALEALRERGDGGGGGGDPLAEIRAVVEGLRGLEFERRVKADVVTQAQLSDRIERLFRGETSRREFEASRQVLVALGVVDPDLDLWEAFIAVHQEQVGGFYDSKKRALVVGARDARNPSPYTRFILAHEYTHALTDQHFDLGRLDRLQEQRRYDAASAWRALVEGDASLVQGLYLQQVLSLDEQLEVAAEAGKAPRAEFDRLPAFLQASLLSPYLDGLAFVQALDANGGSEAIDRAYEDPPVSTEQILHPFKYFEREEPMEVSVPDVRARLGRDTWRTIDNGELGELDLRLLGDEPYASGGLSSRDAEAAAEGWDGGAYVGLRSSRGDVVVAMLTAWDSESEAREAQNLFGQWLPLRYGNIGDPIDAGPTGSGWRGRDGTGMVLRAGDRVAFLFGPDEDTVRRARAAFEGF